MDTETVQLKIKDLNTAAFLIASGLKMSSVEREGRSCYFIFQDRNSALEHCNKFWIGSATVNAKKFCDSLRSLKDVIFSIPV